MVMKGETFYKKKDNCIVNLYEKSPFDNEGKKEFIKKSAIDLEMHSGLQLYNTEYLDELRLKEIHTKLLIEKMKHETSLNPQKIDK